MRSVFVVASPSVHSASALLVHRLGHGIVAVLSPDWVRLIRHQHVYGAES